MNAAIVVPIAVATISASGLVASNGLRIWDARRTAKANSASAAAALAAKRPDEAFARLLVLCQQLEKQIEAANKRAEDAEELLIAVRVRHLAALDAGDLLMEENRKLKHQLADAREKRLRIEKGESQ